MAKNIGVLAETGFFRPKIALTAENSLTAELRLRLNFGFFKAISYGYGVSAKIIFRSHTKGHPGYRLKLIGTERAFYY